MVAGGEEAQACANAGVTFAVVPGITSALAAGCYAGIPATHRDFTSDVAIVTGHRKAGDNHPIEIPRAGTVIFLMAVSNIETIIKSMLEAGYTPDTKIAAVERGSCYDQRVIEGTLETFLTIIKDKPLRTPAIFIAGKVVELRKQLDWFSKKPVILHLGTQPQRYENLGTIVHRQIIECVEWDNNEVITEVITGSAQYDWIVFTSSNGIKFFFKKTVLRRVWTHVCMHKQSSLLSEGPAVNVFSKFGIKADLTAAVESSTGLLEAFANVDLAGNSILLPTAKVHSNQLSEGLFQAGAQPDVLVVYKTIEKDIDDIDLKLHRPGTIYQRLDGAGIC